MQQHIFTVYDQKAKAYLPPFFLPKPEMALRVFTDCVNDPTHAFGKHPADYTLLQIGDFDDTSGEIIPIAVPISIGNGVEFINPPTHLEAEHDQT